MSLKIKFPVYLVFKGNKPLSYNGGFFVFETEIVASTVCKQMIECELPMSDKWHCVPGEWHVRPISIKELRRGIAHYKQVDPRLREISYIQADEKFVRIEDGLKTFATIISFDEFLEKSIGVVGQRLEIGKRRINPKINPL